MTVARELAKYKLHLVGVQEVRWNKEGTVRAGEYTFSMDPGVDGRILLKWIFKNWDGGMDWIGLTQEGDTWRALENAVMNLRVP
jgi:hypothetical protein